MKPQPLHSKLQLRSNALWEAYGLFSHRFNIAAYGQVPQMKYIVFKYNEKFALDLSQILTASKL